MQKPTLESEVCTCEFNLTIEPGVISVRYREGEVVTRENLMAFIVWSFRVSRSEPEKQADLLRQSLEEGLISESVLKDIGNETTSYQPISDEKELIYTAYMKVKSKDSSGSRNHLPYETLGVFWERAHEELIKAIFYVFDPLYVE
jgi:hypothetical protein